jgi:YMGG-like Gly-zipper
MISKFALTALLVLAAFAPAEHAAAQNPLGGAIAGGAAGAIVGGVVGGGRGAAIGAIVGATTGAAIASQGQPRPGGYYYCDRGCYVQRPDGAWILVSPRYCG